MSAAAACPAKLCAATSWTPCTYWQVNPCGSVSVMRMTIFAACGRQPPFILGINDLGTQTQSVVSGQKANLKVVPGGNGPLKYQWYQGHSGSTAFPIAGATSNSLATPAITTATEFWVRVTNACGSRDSATATVSSR